MSSRLSDLLEQTRAFYSLSGGVTGDAASILSIVEPTTVATHRFHNMLKEYPFEEIPPFKVGLYYKNYAGSGYRMMTIEEFSTPEFQEELLHEHRVMNGFPLMEEVMTLNLSLCIKDAIIIINESQLGNSYGYTVIEKYKAQPVVQKQKYSRNYLFGDEIDEHRNPLPAYRYKWSYRRFYEINKTRPCLFINEYYAQVVESVKRERIEKQRRQIEMELLKRSEKTDMKKIDEEVMAAFAKLSRAGQKQKSKKKQCKKKPSKKKPSKKKQKI